MNENKSLITSLTWACKLKNDHVCIRLPIQKELLNMLLHTTQHHFLMQGQQYLSKLYLALFATTYYGLFCIGEVTQGAHVIKAKDVHIGVNKKKLLFILHTSKTHNKANKPQSVKIVSNKLTKTVSLTQVNQEFCPYTLLHNYLNCRQNLKDSEEQFFVFSDHSAVLPRHMRSTLKRMLSIAGFNSAAYECHGLCVGRALDLLKFGLSVETIKKLGWWRSNSVYTYLKMN